MKVSLLNTIKGKKKGMAHSSLLILCFFIALLCSCSNPEVVDVAEIRAQAKKDSTLQAQYDQTLIDQYLNNPANKIDLKQVKSAPNGVKYIISNPAAPSEAPKVNDILSLNYSAQFLNHQVYFTTDEQAAISIDSSSWAKRWKGRQSFQSKKLTIGLPPPSIVDTQNKTLAAILEELAKTKEPLNYTLYRSARIFTPLVVNFTPHLYELSSRFTLSFRSGLAQALSQMNRKSKATLFIPSAAGFGTKGSSAVPPNMVLIYTFQIIKIRR